MNARTAVAKTYPEPHSAFGPGVAVAGATTPAASAVSWGAILAGAAAAAALSLILLILGIGLGLSSVSPWSNNGVSAAAFGAGTILWITLTQLLASGLGGYLSGRLRARWISVDEDEAHFRDTAHGFLAWAVASLTTAALLTSTVGSIVSGGVQSGASLAGGMTPAGAGAAASGAEIGKPDAGPLGYFVDSLFRPDTRAPVGQSTAGAGRQGASERTGVAPPLEIARIFTNSIRTGKLPAEDVRYVGQDVARRTGLTQPEAERRVGETFARWQAALHETEGAAKDAADKARKASAYAALWLVISLLTGAFVASLAATFGGRQRDA